MASVLTNGAALRAVAGLAGTQRQLARNQTALATGLRVATPQDDPASWSIATSMRTRVGELQAVNADLSVSSSIAQVTKAALDTILNLAGGMQTDVVSASAAGANRDALQLDVAARQQAIANAARDATFDGTNWLVSQYQIVETSDVTNQYSATKADVTAISSGALAGSYSEQTTAVIDDTQNILTPNPHALQNTHTVSTTGYTLTKVTQPPGHGTSGSPVYAAPTSRTTTSYDPLALAVDVPASVSEAGVLSATFVLPNAILSSGDTVLNYTTTDAYADTRSSSTTSTTVPNGTAPGLAFLPGFVQGAAVKTAADFSLIGASDTDLAAMGTGLAQFVSKITEDLAAVGTLQNQVADAGTFNTSLINALDSGIGALVDADMNTIATRQAALQTQQSLGVQALSIANDNAALIMKLFAA